LLSGDSEQQFRTLEGRRILLNSLTDLGKRSTTT
jgi:hypothetical protein